MKKLVWVVIAAVCFSQNLWANPVLDKAVDAFYQKNYASAINLLNQSNADTSQTKLLKSLSYLKLGQQIQASNTFSTIDFSTLNLGSYESLLKLRFSLISPTASITTQQLSWLKNLQHHFGNNEFVARISLEVANRLFDSNNLDEAEQLYISLSNLPYLPQISRESLKKRIDIALLEKNQDKAIRLYANLLKNYYSTYTAETCLLAINNTFSVTRRVQSFFDSPQEYMAFIRDRYENDDYEPTKLHINLFLEKYPSTSYKAELLTTVGMCHFLQGKFDDAAPYFQTVITDYPNTFWGNKALFYSGRVLQKQKKFMEASLHYQKMLQDNTHKSFLSEALYYWSINPAATGNIKLTQDDITHNKNKLEKNQYLDKVMWEIAWNELEKGETTNAVTILKSHNWNWNNDDFKAKVLFWTGKLSAPTSSKTSDFYFDKCVQRYPFSYYTYRIYNSEKSEIKASLKPLFKHTGLKPDTSFIALYQLGLGEWVLQDLQFKVQTQKSTSLKQFFSLATLYSKTGNHYAAIKVLLDNGYSIFPKKGVVSKELATLIYPRPHWNSILEASKEFDVDPYLILALMREESLFNSQALSKSGALGLMQLMPFTAEGIAKTLKMPWEGNQMALIPSNNIRFGTWYLSMLKKRFNNNYSYMLSGYNAGPNITQRWVNQKQDKGLDYFVATVPYDETNGYVTRVQKTYWVYKLLYD